MNTSREDPRVTGVKVHPDLLVLELADGTIATAPLELFPILSAGTEQERAQWEVIHGGRAIRWPLLDDDVSVYSVLHPENCLPMHPDAVARHLEKVRQWRERRVTGGAA